MGKQKILKLYKERGETPLERIERFKENNPDYKGLSMTYAGRLDPAAEGLLLVLVGDECNKKEDYIGLDKKYKGEILFGFSTDTGDLLGIPKDLDIQDTRLKIKDSEHSNILENVRMFAKDLVGKQEQKYPKYSSKTVMGRPLWKWSREGKDVDRPMREIEVYDFQITDCRQEKYANILQNVSILVSEVRGDFRQEKILNRWQEVLRADEREVVVCKFNAHVSSGTYIRTLAQELGKNLGVPALLYSLKRTSVGNFHFD